MTVRIHELFENLPDVLSVNDLTKILSKDRTTVYRWLVTDPGIRACFLASAPGGARGSPKGTVR